VFHVHLTLLHVLLPGTELLVLLDTSYQVEHVLLVEPEQVHVLMLLLLHHVLQDQLPEELTSIPLFKVIS